MQAEQPEGPGRVGGQVLVGPGEDRADRGARIAARVQQVQPQLVVAQLGDQLGQRDVGARRGQLGGDPQRQGQPGARRGQVDGDGGLAVDPGADQPAQQCHRVRQGQQVQVDPFGSVHGHHAGQRVAAGDQHQARPGAGQQRAWEFFDAQAPSYRRQAVWWVVSAKRAETRERRLAQLVADSAAGRRLAHTVRP